MTTSRKRNLTIVSGLAVLSLFSLGCEENTSNPPIDDASSSWRCRTDDGFVRATGSVTNNSSEPSNYVVTIDFVAGGRTFDSSDVGADHVRPGETVELHTGVDAPRLGDVSCFVADVARFAD